MTTELSSLADYISKHPIQDHEIYGSCSIDISIATLEVLGI